MKLQVGKTYILRNGEEVKITSFRRDETYPFWGSIGKLLCLPNSWTEDGRFSEACDCHSYDIVKEKPSAAAEDVQQLQKLYMQMQLDMKNMESRVDGLCNIIEGLTKVFGGKTP